MSSNFRDIKSNKKSSIINQKTIKSLYLKSIKIKRRMDEKILINDREKQSCNWSIKIKKNVTLILSENTSSSQNSESII